MYITLVILLVLLSAFLHEMGHIYWLRHYGIKVKDFGFGIPLPYLTLTFWWKGVRCRLSPLIIAAYVKAEDGAFESMSCRQKLDVSGGGPWVNIAFCFTSLLVASVLIGDLRFLYLIIVTGVITLIPKLFGRYLMVPIGCVLMILMLVRIFLPPELAGAGGGGSIWSFIAEHAVSVPTSIAVAGIISLELAALNALPLIPLDGGRSVEALIARRSPEKAERFARISFTIFLAFFFYVIVFGING